MNIWSIQKHKNIKLLLLKMQKHLDHKNICIEDEDNHDHFSIALVKPDQPDVRAYVYTFGQLRDLYGIHLEYPWFSENQFNDSIQVYENLSQNQIINTLITHFEVADYEMAI